MIWHKVLNKGVVAIQYQNLGDRGIFAQTLGTQETPTLSTIRYINIPTGGNQNTFGTMPYSTNSIEEDLGEDSASNGTRGLLNAPYGDAFATNSKIQYITIATASNSSYFGELLTTGTGDGGRVVNRGAINGATKAAFVGGSRTIVKTYYTYNTASYVTINTQSNSNAQANLTKTRSFVATVSGKTRGVLAGGRRTLTTTGDSVWTDLSDMEYMITDTQSSGVNFGQMQNIKYWATGTSDESRGIIFRGAYIGTDGFAAAHNTIEYITIDTTGNSFIFGNLTLAAAALRSGSCSNGNRAVVVASDVFGDQTSNFVDYVVIQTTGNALDFGDTSPYVSNRQGLSGG